MPNVEAALRYIYVVASMGESSAYIYKISRSDATDYTRSALFGARLLGGRLHPSTGYLYYAGYLTRKIWVINPDDLTLVKQFDHNGGEPESISLHGGRVYVGIVRASSDNNVYAYHPDTGALLATYGPIDGGGTDWIDVQDDNDTIIVGQEINTIQRFRMSTGTHLPAVNLDTVLGTSFSGFFTIQIDAASGDVYADGGHATNSAVVVRFDRDFNLKNVYDVTQSEGRVFGLDTDARYLWLGDWQQPAVGHQRVFRMDTTTGMETLFWTVPIDIYLLESIVAGVGVVAARMKDLRFVGRDDLAGGRAPRIGTGGAPTSRQDSDRTAGPSAYT